ncbi:MAG: radical SAM protein [Rhodocyclaceae bacterium]|nr:radical SAM protein [Rhodocyclaceae bacterium]
MNVLMIAPPIMDHVQGDLVPIAMDAHRECPPYGMYLLVATLRARGHVVTFADLIAEGTYSLSSHSKALAEAELIGIGATSMSWPTALAVIKQIRACREDIPIVVGGIHPTMFDRYVLSAFPVNFVVRGEGELGLASLADTLERRGDLSAVPNLSWVNGNGDIVRNPLNQLISKRDLPEFPVPDYSELPAGIYGALSIESSRGCVFDCSFCSTSYRRTWRGIEPETFVDRLQMIMPYVDRTVFGNIHVIDDEFSMNPARATEIAKIIARRGLKPALVYDSRANDLLKEGYVEAIAPFTQQFLVGAECGYDEGLKLIGKGTTCEKLDAAARILKKYGIAQRADFSFVVGLPWETSREVEKTGEFAAMLHAKYGVRILLQWYCQIPGSRLWDDAQRRGAVTEAMYDDYGFFGDLYLFRSGVKLTPDEIYKLSDKVVGLLTLANVRYPHSTMVEYAFPEPIAKYYPRLLQSFHDTGLSSLRDVARPGGKRMEAEDSTEGTETSQEGMAEIRVGRPLRHFDGVHN